MGYYIKMILSTSKIVKVPSALLLAICMQETGLTNAVHNHDGGSPSIGICQVKEATAKGLGYKGTARELKDPQTNIYWAARYIKYQEGRYGDNWCRVTAAYNAGSFIESKKNPGYPSNLRYVVGVQKNIAIEYKDRLSCAEIKLADQEPIMAIDQ